MTESLIYKRSDLAEIIPLLWGERFNDYFKANLIGANFFTDRSSELRGGGDTLYTPVYSAMTANTKTQQAQVTLQQADPTKITLVVQTHKEVSFMVEDIDAARVKTSYTFLDSQAKNGGFEVAASLETAIFGLFAGFSGSVGASTTNLADSDILSAIATLESNKVPNIFSGDVAFFFHPMTFWRQVQAIDKFSLAVNSPVQDPVAKKPVGSLYGIPVYTSPYIPYVSSTTGRYNALAHRDAIHFATLALGGGGSKGSMVGSAGVRVQANYIPEYLATLVTADIVYGVIENRDEAGVRILTHATKA